MPRGKDIPVTPERLAWLRRVRPQLSDRALAAAWAARYGEPVAHGSIAAYCRRNGIKKKAGGGKFAKGVSPWNAGKKGLRLSPGSEFRAGHKPSTWLPIGSYRQAIKDGEVTWLVKVSDRDPERADAANSRMRDWRPVHRLVYETEVAPIPPGHTVILIDGNPDHCMDPGNLACVSRAELVRLNQMGFRRLPPDRALRLAAVARAKLVQAAHDAARALASRYQPQHPET